MLKPEDIRECNRLEKNAKRLLKAASLVRMAMITNEISDLMLGDCASKLEFAADKITDFRSELIANSKHC